MQFHAPLHNHQAKPGSVTIPNVASAIKGVEQPLAILLHRNCLCPQYRKTTPTLFESFAPKFGGFSKRSTFAEIRVNKKIHRVGQEIGKDLAAATAHPRSSFRQRRMKPLVR
jgi:hypothetical protein